MSETVNSRRRVLDVGQCQADHLAISSLLRQSFNVDIEYAGDVDSALEQLQQHPFDLVLVNRILDATLQEGTELIRAMKATEQLRQLPVMLVSNFESAQAEAVSMGAVPGFGKAYLSEPQTRELLAKYLSS